MNILNFGSCNIDHVYSVDHFVRPGETITSDRMNDFPGGKGLNQSIAISRSGAKVFHAGCIGNDGGMAKDTLEEAGVDTRYLKTVDAPTGHAIIQVDKNGENNIIIFGGANRKLTKDYVDEVLSHFDADTVVVLQNEISELSYIIDRASEKGMKIILNPSPFEEELLNIDLDKLFMLILNETEAFAFSKTDNVSAACEFFLNNKGSLKVIITLGADGCIYLDGESGEIIEQSAYCVDVVDTTSAGDTFSGYFVSALSRGEGTTEALKKASAAAALATSKEGASTSIPTKDEVERALNTLKPYTRPNYDEKKEEKIKKYISDNLCDATLSGLARLLGYTPSYAAAKVKAVTGLSFTELLQRERCTRAAGLLLESTMSVDEIIEAVGYKNGNFFRKKFKEIYKMSPMSFRKQKRISEEKK